MPTVTFVRSDRSIDVPEGTNVLEACHRAGVGVPASCGGKGVCGKCRVRVVSGSVPPHEGHEHALSPAEVKNGWRLACKVRIEQDLAIDAGDDAPVRNVILTDFSGRSCACDHGVRMASLALPEPSLEDQLCDLGRIARAIDHPGPLACDLPLMRNLAARLREHGFRVNAVVGESRLLSVLPFDEHAKPLGFAFDIGTTTIAGVLCSLDDGAPLAVASRANPQALRGDDVVSRIGYAAGAAEREELRELVTGAMNEILTETCDAAGVRTDWVVSLTAAGNTTMHHLLLGLDPAPIARSPFVATVRHGLSVRAGEIGVDANEGASLYLLPNISAYVGGDIVAGLLAHEIHESDRIMLLVDVGTNGEVTLRANGTTWACSTAAGPAFEGARIGCGMRAATGAISAVELGESDIEISTIDDVPPRGLCGTGLLDAVAVLLNLGLIDETGAMLEVDEAPDDLPRAIRERLVENDDGPAFRLAARHDGEPDIDLTQRDVRELQLAKGAIAAGIDVLLSNAGVSVEDLDDICLAGGFGNWLRPESAQRVGLLPPAVPRERIRFVGNAALAGARLTLLNGSMRDLAGCIARETKYLELSGRTDFQMSFAESMEFPEE